MPPMEDAEGYPLTAEIPRWVLVVIGLTATQLGVAVFGIYLSLWIWMKRKKPLPLAAFIISQVTLIASALLDHWLPGTNSTHLITWLAIASCFSAPFFLRTQIQTYFRETYGWEPRINLFWTFLFSALYINYCLSPDRSPRPSPLTPLGLTNDRRSAKIDV
jgi:hypothetical protein